MANETEDNKSNSSSNKLIKILVFVFAAVILLLGVIIYHLLYTNQEKKGINQKPLRAIIGIDVGSTKSCYGIILEPFDYSEEIIGKSIQSQIIIHKDSKYGLFIGERAETEFMNNPKNPNNLYFTMFKRNLDPKINRNLVASDYPGDEMELEIILKEFLRILKQEEIENNQAFSNLDIIHEIKYIIALPPLWDIKGKKLMENAAKRIGMVNLEVVLEPEAASLAIFNEDNPKIKNLTFPGSKFLIVDAGGYTVDFSANKILENNNLEQLMIPSSIVNGSSLLNDKIFELVKKVIGEEKVKKTDYSYIKKILNRIEVIKKEINEITDKSDDPKNIALDVSELNLTCGTTGYIFSRSIKECDFEIDGKNLTLSNGKIFIPKKYIYDMILDVSKNIIHYVNSILAKIGSVDLIIFTGGFSQNVIFRNTIKKYTESVADVIFMNKPQESVMKGAALFGLSPTQISRRIVPISIWIESYEIKQETDTTCEEEYFDEQKNQTRCQKYIQFVKRKQSVETNQNITYTIHPFNERIIIYYNYENEITEENRHELGIIDIPYSELPLNNRNLKMHMKFSNYINVTIIDEDENQESSVLLSYPVNKFI